MEIKAKFSKTIIRDKSGKYKACGYNYYKELCIETPSTSHPILSEMDLPLGVKQLESCSYSTYVLMNDGTLKVIGYNYYGQLGLGNNENVTELTDVPNISGIKSIHCGYSHVCLLMEDGTVMGVGYNYYGQLGLGNNENVSEFKKLNIEGNVKDIICGSYSTMILMEDGSLYATGYNSEGGLGLGTNDHVNVFTQVTDIPDNIQSITSAGYYTMIITTDKTLYTSGYNRYGQLGLGHTNSINKFTIVPNVENVKKVACGDSHCLILLEDGTIYGTGYNANGQLGIYNTTDKNVFTRISWSDVIDISCGSSHSVIVTKGDRIRVTGYNWYGQLGLGNSGKDTNKSSFTQVLDLADTTLINCGSSTVFIVAASGTYVSGTNYYGQLGLGDNTNRQNLTQLGGLGSIEKIVSGSIHTVALLKSGHVYATGDNNSGQLGLGTSTANKKILKFKAVSGGANISDICCGAYHTVFQYNKNMLMVTGKNQNGQLGTGDTVDTFTFKYITIPGASIKKVVAAGYVTLILREDGTILVTGYNYYGQLGLGDKEQRTSFTEVKGITNVIDISTSGSHIVLLLKDGTIMVAGNNYSGQLGLGDNVERTTFTKVEGIIGVKKVICASSSTFLIMRDGSVKVAGYNTYGQLGLGDTENRNMFEDMLIVKNIKDISCDSYYTLLLDNYGVVYGVGETSYGQFGISEKVRYTKPFKLPYIQKTLKRYLIRNNEGEYLTVSKDGDKLENVDGLDIYDLYPIMSPYSKHLIDGIKLVRYEK